MNGMAWRILAGAAAVAMLLTAGPAGAEVGKMPSVASMKEAQAMAARQQIPILVDFSAEW